MPLYISNNFSRVLSNVFYRIENPNHATGTLIEEIPSDIGRSYQGYKRGGILEGLERFRRETMAAAVWLGGIPLFNKLGNMICEKVFNLPIDVDYSNPLKGNDAIGDTVRYLKGELKDTKLDTSQIKKYSKMELKGTTEEIIKRVKIAKNITTFSAIALNCFAMGVAIPRINQAITRKKIKEMNAQKTTCKTDFEEFKNKTSPSQPSFTGAGAFIGDFIREIPYMTENNNTFRLISTDVPTLIGRAATSRNKYEALENTVIDAGSIYFYNFCAHDLQRFLRNKVNVPSLNPLVAQSFIDADKQTIKKAMDKVQGNKTKSVSELFGKEFADKIYSMTTFGKYGKINRFVENRKIKEIDNEVYKYLKLLKEKIDYNDKKAFDVDRFMIEAKRYNFKNAALLGLGFVVAIFGLSTLMPRLAFRLTTLLTGKNEFTGIARQKSC